jgi:hypothetical protein
MNMAGMGSSSPFAPPPYLHYTPLLCQYCHFLGGCDYKRDMDWILDLLTAYTHHLDLQVITVAPLISTIYSLLGHIESSQSSLVVSWQQIYNSLTVTTAHIKSSFHSPTLVTLFFTSELPTLN